MADHLQTAIEGLWIVAIFFGLVFYTGFGPTGLLLPEEWRKYRLLLTPIVGWCLLVFALFFVNLAVGVQTGIYAVLLVATVVDLVALRRQRLRVGWPSRESLVPLLIGVGLVAVAMAPQVVQRSLGLLSLNADQEIYYPAASYILSYPILGGPHSSNEAFLSGLHYGAAFQYTMAAVSALSGSLPFNTYIPTSYCLLGLSVPGWYLFFREIFRMGHRGATAATLLYSLFGLPLWFAAYGYGPQMASLVAIPAGTAAFAIAISKGGARHLMLAALVVGTGLTAYYRVIGPHYLFTLVPLVCFFVIRQRHLRPMGRALAVASLALVMGLPSHWQAADFFFVQGVIWQAQQIGQNWSEGWGVMEFEPPSVGLGTAAYVWVRAPLGDGPLSFLQPVLAPFAEPMAWLMLAVASLALPRSLRKRPEAVIVLLGLAAYMAFDRFALDFKYGYFKLLAVAAPTVYGFLVLSTGHLWKSTAGRLGGPARLTMRAAVGVFAALVVVYLGYNSYESYWFSAKGWGFSAPDWLDPSIQKMGQAVEAGSRVFIAGRFSYPVPPDRIQVRKDNVFALQSPEEVRQVWAARVRAMAMTELVHADVYGWFDTLQSWRRYHRLRDDEDYDYYLLAPENDPRLEGLDIQDRVWDDPGLTLYRSRGVVRQTPWTLWSERGSLSISATKALTVQVSGQGLRTNTGQEGSVATGPASTGRLRVGILAFSRTQAVVEMGGDLTRQIVLEPGVTWYITPSIPVPSVVVIRPAGDDKLGAVSLRLLGPGPEEQELVPESVIKDDIYVSSSVLRLENWLTDPFRGKGPGSL